MKMATGPGSILELKVSAVLHWPLRMPGTSRPYVIFRSGS